MTVNSPENSPAAPLNTEKVEENISKPNEQTNNTQPNAIAPSTVVSAGNGEVAEDPDWRAFREARKKDRAERQAAEDKAREKEAEVAALKAAMEAAFAKSPPTPSPYQQYYGMNQPQEEDSEDARIEKKVQAALALREAAAERARIEREQQEYPQRLAQTYADFNQTISQENLDYLDYHYPEVSSPLQRLQDGFDKWSDIYKAVKKFVPNNANAKREAAKADANFNKPKSMSSAAITQPGEVTTSARLTEERRAANWERMQKILKGVS